MTRTPVALKNSTTTEPLEFWIKTSSNGTERAYYWHTRKMPIELNMILMAEAQGTAVRVTEPAF